MTISWSRDRTVSSLSPSVAGPNAVLLPVLRIINGYVPNHPLRIKKLSLRKLLAENETTP